MRTNHPPFDSDLLDALDEMERKSFDKPIWRVVRSSRDPLLGYTSRARWDTGDFDVLYTSLEPKGALEEVFHHLNSQPVFPSKPQYCLYEIRVKLRASARLADLNELQKLGVDINRFKEPEYDVTQEIGGAAYFLGFDGLIVPSARWGCHNAVLFTDRVEPETVNSKTVDWKEWRLQRAKNSSKLSTSTRKSG